MIYLKKTETIDDTLQLMANDENVGIIYNETDEDKKVFFKHIKPELIQREMRGEMSTFCSPYNVDVSNITEVAFKEILGADDEGDIVYSDTVTELKAGGCYIIEFLDKANLPTTENAFTLELECNGFKAEKSNGKKGVYGIFCDYAKATDMPFYVENDTANLVRNTTNNVYYWRKYSKTGTPIKYAVFLNKSELETIETETV